MTTATAQQIIDTINSTSFFSIFREAFKDAEFRLEGNEENGYQSDDTEYAVMFNVETDELFFLHYATKDNGWAEVAASQNPWVAVGYISAVIICADMANDHLVARMECVICNNGD